MTFVEWVRSPRPWLQPCSPWKGRFPERKRNTLCSLCFIRNSLIFVRLCSAHRTYMELSILANNLSVKWRLSNRGPLACPGVSPVSISWILPEIERSRLLLTEYLHQTQTPPPFLCLLPPSATLTLSICFQHWSKYCCAFLPSWRCCTHAHIYDKHRKKHGVKHPHTQKHKDWTVNLTSIDFRLQSQSFYLHRKHINCISVSYVSDLWDFNLYCKCCIAAELNDRRRCFPKTPGETLSLL